MVRFFYILLFLAVSNQAHAGNLKEVLKYKAFPKTVQYGNYFYGAFLHKKDDRLILIQPAFYSRKNIKAVSKHGDYKPKPSDYKGAADVFLSKKGCETVGNGENIARNSYSFTFKCP